MLVASAAPWEGTCQEAPPGAICPIIEQNADSPKQVGQLHTLWFRACTIKFVSAAIGNREAHKDTFRLTRVSFSDLLWAVTCAFAFQPVGCD
jgi:hypothetical protein